ncbi:MAG: tripartite tricarboxylate transporter substrate binding protein [Phreatobacter sp.]|uniref:tripartite tricarboxylate transporter substrate binding protein n=1 Tax=Phreatobacter sp. TaxID=1966341 RepID=UPI001A5CD66E|nr:tripartite tricarboxylate transporter substrate binding protein [Phreatobacter sp.]MBL8571365.1 tripartite tricarboxylate transporter substrate binding protein [Phreatobacter sp.]
MQGSRAVGSATRRVLIGAAAGLAVARIARAAAAPRIIVPYSAGTTIDVVARVLADVLTPHVGERVLVINRDGAAGTLGFVELAQSPLDALTLVLSGPTPLTVHPHLRQEPSLDPAGFAPVCQVYELPFVLAASRPSGMADLGQLIDRARAAPGTLRLGHQGRASATHLQLLGFAAATGIVVNDIPYRAHGQLLADLASGQLDGAMLATGAFDPALVRLLTVFSERGSVAYPGVPAAAALGLPVSIDSFAALYARAGLSAERHAALETACRHAAGSRAVLDAVRKAGAEPRFADAESLANRVSTERRKMHALLGRLGLLPQ